MKNIAQFCIILFLLVSGLLYAKQKEVDSLETALKSVEGESKVDIFNRLSDLYHYIDTKKAIEYAEMGVELADSIGYKKGLAGAYGSLGFTYIGFSTSKAIEYTKKALSIRREINHIGGIATSLNVLGVIYYYSGDYLQSIEYHLNSIKMKEELGNKKILATSYNNVALVYMAVEDFDKALEYLFKAMKLREETNGPRSTGLIKTNIGEIYSRIGDYEKAVQYFNEALELNTEANSKSMIAYSYFCFADLYTTLNEVDNALAYYDSSLVIYKEMEIKNGVSNSENGIANIYKIKKEYDKAIYHADLALKTAEEINSLNNIYNATNTLYYCYQHKNNYKKAFSYLIKNKTVQDSLKNDTKLKKIARIELDYKIEKMKQEQEQELNRQKTFNQYLMIILISAAIILLLIYKGFRNKKLANIKLSELNKQLQEVNTTKDRFLKIIAHDLRGPYQSTLGLSGILASEYDYLSEEEKILAISNLDNSLNKQYDLLNDLLKWAKMQGGNFSIKKVNLSLLEMINDAVAILKLGADKKGISLVNKLSKDYKVLADKDMLNLLLRNLIANSIKFTGKGGIVEIGAEEENDNVKISVSDTGIGIDKDTINKLFRLDHQISNKGTAGEEGSGLGLILCREIIDKHGGSIWVESEVNKGSKFIFTLSKSKESN